MTNAYRLSRLNIIRDRLARHETPYDDYATDVGWLLSELAHAHERAERAEAGQTKTLLDTVAGR